MSSVSVSKNKAKTFVWASLNILVNISVTRLNSVALSKRASRKYICNPMRPSFRSAQWVLAQFAIISPMSWTAGSQCNLSLESVHKPYCKEKKRDWITDFFFSGLIFFFTYVTGSANEIRGFFRANAGSFTLIWPIFKRSIDASFSWWTFLQKEKKNNN